jgi:hypothetical protein
MDGDAKKSFLHRGHRVTVAHWTDGTKFFARAEIHQADALVCVLSRSGTLERGPKLLAGLHAAAVRWAEHHQAAGRQPG